MTERKIITKKDGDKWMACFDDFINLQVSSAAFGDTQEDAIGNLKTLSIPRATFSIALVALKDGKKLARRGWNGNGMFIYYVPKNIYTTQTDIAKKEFGSSVPYEAYIAMKTAQGYVVPWIASQTDLLCEDWIIVE